MPMTRLRRSTHTDMTARALLVMLLVMLLGLAPLAVRAQGASAAATDSVTSGNSGTKPLTAGALPLPFRGGPLTTGYNMWAGTAFSVRTASHSEKFDGAALSLVGVQFSRTLFVRSGIQFSWLVELLPAMVASVSAPAIRIPTATRNAEAYNDPKRFARYMPHDAYGVGLAPFGAELSRPLFSRLSVIYNVTAGGAFFSAVVPYGKATQANFTAATSLAFNWRLTSAYGITTGYNLHHLSNMSMGGANPGMNSHLLYVGVARARFAK